jgi:hypothetical protein
VEDVVKPREGAEQELAEDNENAAVLDDNAPSEFDRSADLMGKLVQVPKAEIDALREKDEKES